MNKRNEIPFVNLGISSLLVVFLVLCLVIFAVLSLSAARSDLAFSQRLADRKTVTYAARSQAESLLSALDARLQEQGCDADVSDLGFLRQGDTLTLSLPVADGQTLHLALRLTPNGAHYYELTTCKMVAPPARQADSLPLMNIGGD